MAKKLRFLFTLLFVMAATLSWGDNYTITFKTGSSDGTTVFTSTACSTIVSEGASYLKGNVATATKAYYGGSSGLKLGTSSENGIIKMNLSSTITPTSIVVNAQLYNSSKSATLKVNGSTAQSISASFSNITFAVNSEISYIELESSKYCWIKSITVNYAEDTRVSTTTTFPQNSYTAYLEEGFTAPVATLLANGEAFSGELSYSSSNTSVASVASDGSVTLKKAGTTTITASYAGNDNYIGSSASYTLKVENAPIIPKPINIGSGYYVKVTSADKLVDGDVILIVNESNKCAMSTTQNTNNRGQKIVTITNGIIDTPEETVQKIILVKSGDNWYLNVGENNNKNSFLYAASSSKNYLKSTTDPDNNALASISVTNGNATIIFQGDNTRKLLKYNSSDKLFSCYASGQQDIQIYKEVPVVAQIGDVKYETLAAAVAAATEGQTVKVIKSGEYTLPNLPKNIAIEGAESIEVLFKHTTAGNIASVPNGATFKNVKFEFGNVNYHGFQHAGTINMESCTLSGRLTSYGDMNFTNCQFVQTNEDYHMWTYSGNVTYTDCTFTNEKTGKFINVYNESGATKYTVTATNCKFINKEGNAANKAAINVKATSGSNVLAYDVIINSCTTEGAFPEASSTDALVVLNSVVQVDDRTASGVDNITVTQDGVLIYPATVAAIGETRYPTLQSAVDAAQQMGGEVTINIIDNISEETVTIQEVANFKLTIDGKKDENSNYTVDAVIVVDGLRGNGGSSTNGASVTLQNIAFVKTTSTDGIQASHYPHHLTIQDCTYTGSDSDKWFLNASVDGPLYGVTVKNVTVEHARLIYANMAEDAVFQNITATTDCKVGFNVKTSGTALIENCQVTTAKYAFRDYSDGYVGTFTLKDNTFISTSTGSDEGAIVNRGGAVGTTHINVVSGNYSGKILVLNNKEGILAISGGIFSERVADEYLAEGKICASNTDEETSEAYPFIVREGHYRAQVGEQKYEFFADAVEALTEENNVVTLLADVEDEYTLTVGQTLNVIKGEFALTVNAPEGYELKISEADGITTYTSEAPVIIAPAAPIVFHDSGEYEAGLSVPMYAQAGAKIYYTTDGSEPTTASTEYTGALTIENATTVKAIAVLDGVVSAVVTREYTIKAAADEIEAIDGYYSIKNNGNEKYINVAGRKTVTFVADGDEADKAGTVLKVKINKQGQVEELRSQGVDLPGYADRAMNYVPEIVELVVNKLHAEGSGEILGEHGLDAIMQKFNDSFDYHLYVEKADAGYRIYGKTPSMKPVVDFYAENKDNVDYKLPQLEAFINSAIQKVLQKTGGRGASILTEFKLHDIWQKMGETLTEPVKDDAASIAKFYEEVLSSEANVWNFAYQTAMIYWGNVKNHPRYEELKGMLGEYAKYIEKVENIRPNFKYYIVANEAGNDVDFISQGNTDINAARATWTLEKRTDFKVTFSKENSINLGRELYTTLYTDFAYTVPEKVKAYKVTAIDEKTGLATKEEISGVIPAQTPVLLQMIVDPKTVTDADLTQTLTLSTEAGTAVTGNLLQGPDALINAFNIKTAQVVSLFDMAKEFLGESAYNTYVKEYEHLQMKNAGTVNNKYFFGIGTAEDTENKIYSAGTTLRTLFKGDKKLGFYLPQDVVKANTAFILDETNPVLLSLVGDVTRDGKVNISDVTAQIDIILDKDTPEDNYDYDAADVDGNGEIKIKDVTDLIDIILGKDKN